MAVRVATPRWRTLAARLDGPLILPPDRAYPEVRRASLRQLTEDMPQAVVRCQHADDVRAALAFTERYDLPFAIRAGGHSFADFSSTSGLLIDVQAMASTVVTDGAVAVGPGVRIAGLADRLAAAGALTPVGWCPSVGVVGAALGGGYGMFSRALGLACDHLVGAEVVLADGRTVQVDSEREPELFWALRGAGAGSFGVVTSLALRTHPLPEVGTVFGTAWRMADAVPAITMWQRWAPEAAATLNAELVLVAGRNPQAPPLVVLFGLFLGEQAAARRALAEFEAEVGPPVWRVTWQELAGRQLANYHMYAGVPADRTPPEPLPPGKGPGRRVLRSEFFDQPLPAPMIVDLVAWFQAEREPGQHRELEFVPWRGAYQHPAAPPAAVAHRSSRFLLGHNCTIDPGAGEAARRAVEAWVDRSWEITHPAGSGRVYPNYPDPALIDWSRAYYGAHLDRLREVKAAYDPGDRFRFAQSVPLP